EWLPWLRVGDVNGEVHDAAVPLSTLQVVVTGATPPLVVKVTAGVVVATNAPLAGLAMFTARPAAIVKVTLAWPTLPAWSVAATVIVCVVPGVNGPNDVGLVHGVAVPESSLHVVPVTDEVASVAVNARLTVVPVVEPFGGL